MLYFDLLIAWVHYTVSRIAPLIDLLVVGHMVARCAVELGSTREPIFHIFADPDGAARREANLPIQLSHTSPHYYKNL